MPTGPVEAQELPGETVPWHGGFAYGASATTILFGQAGPTRLDQQTAAIAAGRAVGSWAVRGVLGVVTRTSLGDHESLGNGWLAGVSAARRLSDQKGILPDVGLSLALAVSKRTLAETPATTAAVTSADVRVGLEAGWELGSWHLHGIARTFGGPVWWTRPGLATDLGGDHTHVQIGAGVSRKVGALHLFGEVIPVGESGATFGLGF